MDAHQREVLCHLYDALSDIIEESQNSLIKEHREEAIYALERARRAFKELDPASSPGRPGAEAAQ